MGFSIKRFFDSSRADLDEQVHVHKFIERRLSHVTVLFICLLFFLITLIRVFMPIHSSVEIAMPFIGFFASALLLVYLLNGGVHVKRSLHIYSISILGLLIYSIFHFGGLRSVNFLWLIPTSLYLVINFSKREVLLYFLGISCTIFTLNYSSLRDLFPMQPVESDVVFIFFSFFIFGTFTIFNLFLKTALRSMAKDAHERELNFKNEVQVRLDKERYRAALDLISRYHFEINNPLFIAHASLQRYKKDPNLKNLERTEQALERIGTIIKKIEKDLGETNK